MSHRKRNIEEEFQAISPPGYRGIPTAQPIAVGVTGSGGADSAASLSQASQEISQLEEQFRQQAELIQANTQALQNSSSHSGSVGRSIAGAATGILGGGLGLLSPLVSGIMSLFGLGGSKAAPAPLPFYTAPPSVQMSDTLRSATPAVASAGNAASSSGSIPGTASASNAAPQVTVNVSAMDSQSFMDRSGDIASAVREAMLNLHPINDVVANL
jgi:hypothetical protein